MRTRIYFFVIPILFAILSFAVFSFPYPTFAAPIESASPLKDFKLQIPIPGFDPSTMPIVETSGDSVKISGIGFYVRAIYSWLTTAVGVIAVLAFMYGGVLWLTAGGNAGNIKQAQEIIKNTLVGMGLLLGSYVILYTIDPGLVTLNPLSVKKLSTFQLKLTLQDQLSQSSSTAPIGKDTQQIANNICANSGLVSAYKAAAEKCNIPWEIFAGVHYRERGNETASNPMQFDAVQQAQRARDPRCNTWPTALDCACELLKGAPATVTATTDTELPIKQYMSFYNCGVQDFCKNGDYFYVSNDPENGKQYHIKGTIDGGATIDTPDSRPGSYIIYRAVKEKCH